MDKVEGCLEVGRNEAHEIVVNHPDLKPDANGVGHIVFSVDQARHLARLLQTHAAYAERESKQPEKGLLPTIKVFEMNDCDWYAAATADEAVKAMAENLDIPFTPQGIAKLHEEYSVEDPSELSEEVMNSLNFRDEDPEEGTVELLTFRKQLDRMIANGDEFPCFFASTEG